MFEQIKPVLDEAPEVSGAAPSPVSSAGAIEARKLSFRYTDDGPLVLDDVSFRVRPGEFVAVVGPSGCGKSTLLRLLIGFDRPASGSVLYDGQDLAALDQAAVRRQCGVVLQNAQPFTGSILDCICGAETVHAGRGLGGRRDGGTRRGHQADADGHAHHALDGGGAVSGGQRQRLMIAQALIRRPRILFFDEATSALDNETQRTRHRQHPRLQRHTACDRPPAVHRHGRRPCDRHVGGPGRRAGTPRPSCSPTPAAGSTNWCDDRCSDRTVESARSFRYGP